MNRRDALKYTSLSFGYAITATSLGALMQSCQSDVESDGWSPAALSKAQANLLAEIAETMLPETDTPGAKSVMVHRYIDKFYAGYLNAENRGKALNQFKLMEAHLNQAGASKFVKLSAEERLKVLGALNSAALKAKDPNDLQAAYLGLKGLVISTFFSTEKIGTEVLAYAPVPGPYKGCIPLESVGKAWSL